MVVSLPPGVILNTVPLLVVPLGSCSVEVPVDAPNERPKRVDAGLPGEAVDRRIGLRRCGEDGCQADRKKNGCG